MSADLATSVTGRVARLERLGPALCVVWLEAPRLPPALPGQFLHVRVGDGYLRRPFSVYRQQGDEVALLVQVKGRGTRWLAGLAPGAEVDLLGPLGRGFSPPARGARILLVGGGVGVAPLVRFAEAHAGEAAIAAVLGFRSAAWVVGDARLAALGVPVALHTEDGSVGVPGRVTAGLSERLREAPPDRVFVCGPDAMMRAVAGLCEEAGVRCEVSLERPMGCGYGVCLLCVVPVQGDGDGVAYERVCCDGPVFEAGRLAW
jgi:dihydroorotate dehydrogenase electron transfer subunit